MDKKSNAAKLIKATQYGKKMPPPVQPTEFSVKKEMKRMETETQNLNNAEKISPNPLYKKEKPRASLGFDSLKDMNPEELDELLKLLADTKKTETEDVLSQFVSKMTPIQFNPVQAPAYRFPGYFNA